LGLIDDGDPISLSAVTDDGVTVGDPPCSVSRDAAVAPGAEIDVEESGEIPSDDFVLSSWNLLTSASTLRMSVIQGLIGSTLLRARRHVVPVDVVVASLLFLTLLSDLDLLSSLESRRLSPPPLITVKKERKASSDQSRLF